MIFLINNTEIDSDLLDIMDYPDTIHNLTTLLDEYKNREKEIINEINLVRSEILLAIDEERDIIGGRQVRKYSSENTREAKLIIQLNKQENYNKLQNTMTQLNSEMQKIKNFVELLRRNKQILIVEYQNHGTRCMGNARVC